MAKWRDPDISTRAWKAVAQEAKLRKTSVRRECDRLGIDPHTVYQWKNGIASPSAFVLQILALAEYDVIWILKGD